MEKNDLLLIEKFRLTDKELDELYKEHCKYEVELEKFNEKSYLTPSDEMERKTIQKKKLAGKDRIEQILRKYRNCGCSQATVA